MKPLLIAFAIAVAGCISVAAAAETKPARPNIVFILCDDLGYGDVGAFYQNQRAALQDRGVPFFATPQIDTLARDGAKLTQHYCGAPVCAPSRASLLTGLTQGHANVRDNQFDKALAATLTLGSVLRQAGYATAAIGKWGLQGKPGQGSDAANAAESSESPGGNPASWPAYPTRRGFDFYFGYVRHKDGHFHYPKEDQREVWENDREVSGDLDLCYTTDLFTARTKKWIVDHTASHPQQPFFVYLAFDTPHAKLQNPPCAYPSGGGLKGGVQWTGTPHAMLNTATGIMDGYLFPDYANATWDDDRNPATAETPWPDVQKRYANDVRRIDFAVGDVLQLLKDLKIDDNTLVVFTSDNGPSIESYLPNEPYTPAFFRGFGPFDGIKRDTLEGGEREPTLVRWPGGIPAGRAVLQPSGQWDWLATFADFAGLPAPAASDGVSLAPSLTGRGQQRAGTLYVEYFEPGKTPRFEEFAPAHRGRTRNQMQTIYLDGFKGIRYDVKSAGDDFEIYDLAKDPREASNLAGDPRFAALQAAMKARVLQVRKPNASAKRPYDEACVPAMANDPGTKPGITQSVFKGAWPWMPDFRTLTPDARNISQSIALPAPADDPPFGAAFEGFFQIPADGDYTFSVEADGGAMLFVHDIRVIDEPGNPSGGTLTGNVRLKAGWHPMRLYYRHFSSKPQFEFGIKTADGKPLKLDASNLQQMTSSLSAAELREDQVSVTVDAAPAAGTLAPQVRVWADAAGRQTLVITLTNTNSIELAVRGATVEFPWVEPDGAGWRIASGAWSMGQNPAHVYAAGESQLIQSESYLLARGGGDCALAGFTTWKTFTSRITYQPGRAVVTVDGEGRRIRPGESVMLEKIWFARGPDWQDLLFGYADEIARENKIRLNRPKPYTGWATWDYYLRGWTARNVTDNLEALLQVYPKSDFLQIDGGWWPQRGDYTRVKPELEPDGMKTLAHLIHDKGMVAGIHLDGMRGDSKAIVAKEHPDYFLKDQRGEMLVKSQIKVGNNLDYTFFDYSNPAARDYIRQAFSFIRHDWGFDYFKVDFLGFGLNEYIKPFVNQGLVEKRDIVPFDRSLTSVERFHLGMAAIREGMGADAYFVGCSAIFGPTFGHVDGLRAGADISPGFKHYKKSATDTAGSFFLHGKVVYNDADYVVVRAREDQDATLTSAPEKDGGDLKLNEAEMWAHYVGLFGGIKLNSDNLPILREERRALFRLAATLPTSERFVPIDFWQHERNSEDPPGVILGEAGGVVRLGVFNWTDAPKEFRMTGLSSGELMGVIKLGGVAATQIDRGTLTVSLPARHSSLFRIDGAAFDRLRKAMQEE